MRDHIRREAGQFSEAVWWLVPVAFAAAGVATVAFSNADRPEPRAVAAAPSAVTKPEVKAVSASAPAAVPARVEEPVYDPQDHVETF